MILFGLDIFIIQPNFVLKNIALTFYGHIFRQVSKLLNIIEVFVINNYKFLKFHLQLICWFRLEIELDFFFI